MLNEADTRARVINSELHESGRPEDKILRDKVITLGKNTRRKKEVGIKA